MGTQKGKRKNTGHHFDPHLHPRVCATCGQLILGYTDYGLTWWMDAEPCTPAVEQIYTLAGRRTYSVRIQPSGGAWVDTRLRGLPWPDSGVVLVEHHDSHQPSRQRAAPPHWLTRPPRPTPAPTDPIPF